MIVDATAMAVEVVLTFDRLARHGKLTAERAHLYAMQRVDGVGTSVVLRTERGLLSAAWKLRDNLQLTTPSMSPWPKNCVRRS